MAKRSKGAKRALKRGPKVLRRCRYDGFVPAGRRALGCRELPPPFAACKTCPGPQKYRREDKP